MRKTLIAAVAAFSVLAMAAVAIAQAPAITTTAKVSPSKAGTKKQPKSETLFLTINNDQSSIYRASSKFGTYTKLNTTGLKSCSVATLNDQGTAACPSGSKAGTGTADALVNPTSANPAPLHFNVTTFVAGKNKLAFYLQEKNNPNGVQQALPASIGKKGSGQKIVIKIPANLQQPAPGVYSALVRITNSLGLKSGKHALVSSVGCQSKKHKIGVTVTYVPNPNPPEKPSASSSSNAKCS